MMKNTIKLLITTVLLATTLSSARASIIYNFNVSDVSWAASTSGDFSGTNIWFEFTDSADLNALNNSDLLNMGFATTVDHVSFSNSVIEVYDNLNDLFNISGSVASLTVGGAGSAAVYCSNYCDGNLMQIAQGGGSVSLLFSAAAGLSGSAYNSAVSQTYYSSTAVVPVPAAVWLFGSGLIGLAGFSKCKKA